MNIFLSQDPNQSIPDGFDAVTMTLDASVQSLLEWKLQIQEATQKTEEGKKLFWLLDFGGYDLPQIETFRLAIEHFEKEIWERFGMNSIGVCLYRGRCDLEDDHLDFLEQLAGSLPDDAEAFILLDASFLSNAIEVSRALSKERFPHFTVAVKGIDQPPPEFGWENVSGTRGMIGGHLLDKVSLDPSVGVCVPSKGTSEPLENVIQQLKNGSVPFRMIPEALMTTEWHGLDHIIVDADTVDPLGLRRLMGFCAAGGTIVTLGEELGVPVEVKANLQDLESILEIFQSTESQY